MKDKLVLMAEAGEPTLFDSLARLVPKDLQAAYYRVLAHTRTLSPDDEMLRILEAMGVLAMLTRHTPKDIAEERERFQQLLESHQSLTEDAREKTRGYVRELESRLANLPEEIEAGLAPEEIAKMLGESLRQNFIHSGLPDTAQALRATSAELAKAQQQLSNILRILADGHGGIVAQVESSNQRIEYSIESRAKRLDGLVHEWKTDLVRIWIPMIVVAALLIGMLGGMGIHGFRDSALPAETPRAQSTVPSPASAPDNATPEAPNQQPHSPGKESKNTRRER